MVSAGVKEGEEEEKIFLDLRCRGMPFVLYVYLP